MRVVLAPSWLAAAARSLLLIGAMLLVAVVMFAAKGPTQSSRDVRRNEIVLYAPRLVGIAQFGGEALLVVVLTWGCREGLKIRL